MRSTKRAPSEAELRVPILPQSVPNPGDSFAECDAGRAGSGMQRGEEQEFASFVTPEDVAEAMAAFGPPEMQEALSYLKERPSLVAELLRQADQRHLRAACEGIEQNPELVAVARDLWAGASPQLLRDYPFAAHERLCQALGQRCAATLHTYERAKQRQHAKTGSGSEPSFSLQNLSGFDLPSLSHASDYPGGLG
ncbi:hypothetical protein DIPPA_14926 [Diplonema papillatum]|nr:hypothetical protein DIPPA_14926 [Diplonema papillatum]